ncbi:MAG: S8 family serine peptidase, partial [Candidatus Competibacteraceae bacterium]
FVTRLRVPAGVSAPQARRNLARRIPEGYFVLNHIYRVAAACPEDRCYGSSLIGWEASGRCGRGIKLGMVDTAVNKRNPALSGRRVTTRSFAEDGRASSPTHGTAVAALLVGAPSSGFPGLLPNAELYAADTFIGTSPETLRTNVLLLSQGLDWLLEQQVAVVNVSLTGPANRLLRVAVGRLNQQKIPLIAAAGNGGPGARPAFPAAYPETVSVTAVDQLLRPYRLANRGDYLTVAAPGVRIWTPGPRGGQYSDGTSFATPHVTAVAALLRHRQPGLDHAGLAAKLQTNARDLGAPGKDPVFGWGLVQSPGRCE